MYFKSNWAVISPLANEERDFDTFVSAFTGVLNQLGAGTVYLVVDEASTDRTPELCRGLSAKDQRYITVWAPENNNVVDAYLRGYREAYDNGHDIIIEMDAGLSHDPRALPMFLRALSEGNECAFGSRFIDGGSMDDSPLLRRMLSRTGTVLANVMLGTRLCDMTSGFQGFRAPAVKQLLDYQLLSQAHFYQTEVRYLMRKKRFAEIPIRYLAPSPRVSRAAVMDAVKVFLYYLGRRVVLRARSL